MNTASLADYSRINRLYSGERFGIYRAVRAADQCSVILKYHQNTDDERMAESQRLLQHEYALLKTLSIEGVICPSEQFQCEKGLVTVFPDTGAFSLKSLIARQRLNTEQFLCLGSQLASILAGLHRHKIIHKQISPDNILLSPVAQPGPESVALTSSPSHDTHQHYQVQLIDFSRASQLEREPPHGQDGQLKSEALPYIAPEQTGRINRSVDYRTDFYALGATLYELLTGKPPFSSRDRMELLHSHIAKTPEAPDEQDESVPAPLSQLVMRLLAKDASARYQSSVGLSHDLRQCRQQWLKDGHIADFPLGSRDLTEHFVLPQQLYGREERIKELIRVYNRVARGHSEISLISGYAGVGKSSLVHEIRQYISARNGHFVSGKFGQFGRNRPYAAIIQALQNLIRQLLTEPDHSISLWKTVILNALGRHAGVLTRLIPELELIIGEQPQPPVLPTAEEKNRFSRIFQQLIQVFTHEQRPLVLFLDDLHWADQASLDLIQSLISHESEVRNTRSLMLIGSYRIEEVKPDHPLSQVLQHLKRLSVPLNQIDLKPLEVNQINQLLQDTLSTSRHETLPLARICHEKTQGNPFFLNQFLTTLNQEQLIFFADNRWQWRLDLIRNQSLSDNVVDLMIRKIRGQSEDTQKILTLAACMGNQFNLSLLARISEYSVSKVASLIWPCLQERLIYPLDGNYFLSYASALTPRDTQQTAQYRFAHDRIQQAAYSLLGEQEQKKSHLKIGLLLYEQQRSEPAIFEITHHLNLCWELLDTPEQKTTLAAMNLKAGEASRTSAAFEASREYFSMGRQLLENNWHRHYDLMLSLSTLGAESALLQGRIAEMEALIGQVRKQARTLLDQVFVYELEIQARISENRFNDALTVSLNILKLLGIEIPPRPTALQRIYHRFRTHSLIRQFPIEKVRVLDTMNNPYMKAALPIMASMFGIVKFSNPGLRPLVMAKQVEITLKYGLLPSSAQAFAGYGGVLCGYYMDIEQGYQLGQIALQIDEQLPSRLSHHKTLSLYNSYVRHWKEPLSSTLDSLLQGHQSGLECGDIEWSTYCLATWIQYRFPLVKNLADDQPEIEHFFKQIKASGQKQSEYYSRYALQTMDNLRGLNSNPLRLDGRFNQEDVMLRRHLDNNHRTAVCMHHFYKALLAFLFNDYQAAEKHCHAAEQDLESIGSTYTSSWLIFLSALTQLKLATHDGVLESGRRLHRVRQVLKKIQLWAEYSPENQRPRLLLLKGELARVQKRFPQALNHYDEALKLSEQGEVLLDQAMICEMTAHLFHEWDKPIPAEAYLSKALNLYQQWGADAKAEHMVRHYALSEPSSLNLPEWSSPVKEQHRQNNQMLDTLAVMRASHAIADEIVLERLLARLIRLALENAGAQKAILALKRDHKLCIEAEDSLTGQAQFFSGLSIDEAAERLPANILHYVQRTKETVVLSNALEHDMFMQDSYIRKQQPRSLLCMPILYHGNLTAVLYLENKESADVFNRERLETLQILSAQAAISIENAKLYQSLQKSEQAFRSLFENAIEGIFRMAPSGQLLAVNPALASMMGYDSSEGFLQSCSNLNTDCFAQTEQSRTFFTQLCQQGEVIGFATQWRRQDKSLLDITLSARSVSDEKGQRTLFEGSVADISEQRKKEAAEQARMEAVLAQKEAEAANEAKSQFLATMSHEIRTPLNGVLGMTQLMLQSDLSALQQQQMNSLLQSGKTLLNIVNDVLDFSRAEAGQLNTSPHRFSLSRLVDDMSLQLSPLTANKPVQLQLTITPDYPDNLYADSRLLVQVLMNLCSNAIKFTDEGHVDVCIGQQPVSGSVIPVPGSVSSSVDSASSSDRSDWLYCAVSDTGIGIPAQAHNNIFQHFSQADVSITRRYGGSGLGLSICKQIVELMGGEIGFSSQPGKGSVFWFSVPVQCHDQSQTQVPATPSDQAIKTMENTDRMAPLHILLVEDIPVNQEVAAGLLTYDGHTVDIAEDGYTALSLHNDNDYDLVLMDINLPDMSGLEATEKIRAHKNAHKAGVPVIALTAAITEQEVNRYQQSGIHHVLSKPVQRAALNRALSEISDPTQNAQEASRNQVLPLSEQSSTETRPETPSETASSDSDLLNAERIQQHAEALGQAHFSELLQAFETQFIALENECHDALPNRDQAKIVSLSHRMSGSAANFGLQQLQHQCHTLEQLASETPPPYEEITIRFKQIPGTREKSLSEIRNIISN